MTPSRLLLDLLRAGFKVSVDGDKLNVDGPLDRLDGRRKALIGLHKAALVKYCTPSPTHDLSRRMAKLGLPMDDRLDLLLRFNERAGIREFDGGYPRQEAEHLALDQVISQLDEQPSEYPPETGDCLPAGACSEAGESYDTPDTPQRARIDVRGIGDEMGVNP